MKYKNISIILGAGSSKSYSRCYYPLLNELLSEMFKYADKLSGRGKKQRLYMAYALSKANGLDVKDLEKGAVSEKLGNEKYATVKALYERQNDSIADIFCNIEKLPNNGGTTAFWALSSAIAIYMWQKYKENISQYNLGIRNTAHRELLVLINCLVLNDYSISVIDFNYDCVLEFEKDGLGRRIKFHWDCGREQKVIAEDSENRTASELVKTNCFMEPKDKGNYEAYVKLIKPHGDWCTFLMGDRGVYYRGGRHSQTSIALFPEKLKDMDSSDAFLRCSIMPPTESRYRLKSSFYAEEVSRLKLSLQRSGAVLIVGWSASGTDNFYKDIFKKALSKNASERDLYIIDKSSVDSGASLKKRVSNFFNDTAKIKYLNLNGFDEYAVEQLKQFFT